MRLFSFHVITSFLAVHHIARVCAYPTDKNGFVTATVVHEADVIKRAPAIVVPVEKESLHATWRGYRVLSSVLGSTVLTEAAVVASAKATYYSIADKTSSSTLLVSVMYIPNAGVTAGTIWVGSDQSFEGLASNHAPAFWGSLSGETQRLRPWTGTRHMWHAEAVAVITAEEEFEDAMKDGVWPDGTMIYTFGRVNGVVQDKASCEGDTSPVAIPCATWLDRLHVNIIEP